MITQVHCVIIFGSSRLTLKIRHVMGNVAARTDASQLTTIMLISPHAAAYLGKLTSLEILFYTNKIK